MRELPSQVKETLSIKGRGSAGLRRLSRRGSWVRIPPPAPNLRLSAHSIALCGPGCFLKSRIFFFYRPISVWVGFWLVFRELGHYRLLCNLPICAYCRSDQREM